MNFYVCISSRICGAMDTSGSCVEEEPVAFVDIMIGNRVRDKLVCRDEEETDPCGDAGQRPFSFSETKGDTFRL